MEARSDPIGRAVASCEVPPVRLTVGLGSRIEPLNPKPWLYVGLVLTAAAWAETTFIAPYCDPLKFTASQSSNAATLAAKRGRSPIGTPSASSTRNTVALTASETSDRRSNSRANSTRTRSA